MSVALALTGCTEKVSYRAEPTGAPSSRPATKSARPSVKPKPSRTADPVPGPGTLRIVVQDEDDLDPRSGVPITYTGPRSGKAVSDANGRISIKVPAGDYTLHAEAGCHDRVEIFKATSGSAGVAPDETTAVRLKVNARKRYWGGTPLQHDLFPPWPAGEVVTFRYRLFDRCKDVEAPGKRIDDVTYKGVNIQVVGTPARKADASSDVVVKIRCIAGGDARLMMTDPDNPDDTTDLLALRPPSIDPDARWCGDAA